MVKLLIGVQQDPLFEKHSGLRTILGHLDVQLLKDVDVVVVSPGVPLENYGLSSLMESVSQFIRLIIRNKGRNHIHSYI